MIKVGIVGISGYSGLTALEILLKHPHVRVTYVSANNTEGSLSDIWPQLTGRTNLYCKKFDLKTAVDLCDLIFLAVPHTASLEITPGLLNANKRVVDLSGDYRLKNIKDYEKWYGAKHGDAKNLKKAVYGLPELYRQDIVKAQLISNPGCYPTAALLALAPLSAFHGHDISSIIIDAKSGVSGAGRKAKLSLNFTEVNENFKAYKVLHHQHAPEIDLYLSKFSNHQLNVHFVPHLLPINRGILETIYVHINEKMGFNELYSLYQKFYKTEPFVRLLPKGQQPEIKHVTGTNMCDLGLEISADSRLIVITSVIDNLVKGAAGQAVQNMNIMCGFKEAEGLV
ncbi:MAG TPA: N-acetyl-gamma-glutamyl-phosphate reductase [Candidatus Omnitrophica bacterium]|nr:MAG: N-acetyl-gamma-glutamyl-phosphate reductase [Omnitrophica WOR_2 bacterium GWA2_45_18]OGX20709.1 MAG: N-acetyl-gamma-glutamyl-phosphate reductase [Omnitrophica WOR_2 bacterium GWC2_45_7]HBR15444.1 N-acetyl-gamma-glutamyl-phosphate reductase [Candidatus Omnitrophota bacterium]